jgi:hypothetical protein
MRRQVLVYRKCASDLLGGDITLNNCRSRLQITTKVETFVSRGMPMVSVKSKDFTGYISEHYYEASAEVLVYE